MLRKLRSNCFYFLFVVAVLFTSCSNDEDTVAPANNENQPTYLVSLDTFSIRSAGDLQIFVETALPGIDPDIMKYDAVVLKMVYNTKYKGETIQASGLVILPSTTDEVEMLSFQHGTISANSDAPSNITLQDQAAIFYASIASAGMIAVIPDFIGFGASADIPHPYYVEDLTASAVIDNIRAAEEIAEMFNLNYNGELFLAGYSQGGFATMATHKWIEEKGLGDLNLIASFPSSGGYDVKGFQEYFFELDTYHQPFYMAYVVNGYNSAYEWGLDYKTVFNEPYASRITDLDLFNGQYSNSEINDQLNDTLSVLLNANLMANFETDPAYSGLKNQLIENSLTDWTPQVRMFMYHGDADVTVPYQNSIDTYDKLIDNGTSTEVLTFKALPGSTHGTGVLPYISELITELEIIRN